MAPVDGCVLGNSEPQIVHPIGMMLIGTALLAVPCFFAKQSQILCYIIVGVVVGHVKGPSGCTWKQEMHLSDQTAAVLFDLGILFVLFMGGMEVDLGALKAAWKLVLINGMGQIILNLVSFTVICILCANPGGPFDGMQPTVKDKDGVEVPNFGNNPDAPMWGVGIGSFFFGICYTLSSTILVLGALKKRGELGKLHGQIILGLMVLQDVTAVLSIAVMLNAFKAKPIKGPNARRGAAEGEAPKQEPGIGEILGGLIMWLILLPIFLYILNKTVLAPVFKFFAKTRELLFIITFAYSLGVAALFGHFLPYWIWGSFSQEIGIFFAGVSIAALPYRVQIETFVEPIRAFGVVLFFFILGINLPVNSITPMAVFMGVILALLTVFVFPMFLWLTGWLSGVDGKTAFLIGLIVNQVSEFSLIIGEMAYRENIFTNTMFLTIVIGTLITFVFSSMGHLLADSLYDKIFCKCLSCLDSRATVKDEAKESFKLSDHIVLLGFNEIGLEISEFFREHEGMDVLVIHDNPDLHILFESFYNPGQAAIDVNDAEKGGRIEDKVATNIYSQYADPNNPDTWHHYELHAAGMVVSCQQGTTESDCVLADDLANPGHGHEPVPFLCLCDSNTEARVMYEAGVRYVIQSEALTGRAIRGQMHNHNSLEKATFMADYIRLHKEDMEEEQINEKRKQLEPFLAKLGNFKRGT